jgi:hypothetical protein
MEVRKTMADLMKEGGGGGGGARKGRAPKGRPMRMQGKPFARKLR